ncbi:AT-hook motif nuclear-localized protein 11 [Linum perenne]
MEPPPPHQPQQHQGSMLHQQPPNQEAAVLKRKRGRPRKYGPDGTASLALSPSLSSSSTHPGTITPTTTQKRGRGRPPGTGKKQQLLASSVGGKFDNSELLGGRLKFAKVCRVLCDRNRYIEG